MLKLFTNQGEMYLLLAYDLKCSYLWSQLEVLITNGMGTRDISIRTAAMTFMEECAKASSSGSNIETTERLPVVTIKLRGFRRANLSIFSPDMVFTNNSSVDRKQATSIIRRT